MNQCPSNTYLVLPRFLRWFIYIYTHIYDHIRVYDWWSLLNILHDIHCMILNCAHLCVAVGTHQLGSLTSSSLRGLKSFSLRFEGLHFLSWFYQPQMGPKGWRHCYDDRWAICISLHIPCSTQGASLIGLSSLCPGIGELQVAVAAHFFSGCFQPWLCRCHCGWLWVFFCGANSALCRIVLCKQGTEQHSEGIFRANAAIPPICHHYCPGADRLIGYWASLGGRLRAQSQSMLVRQNSKTRYLGIQNVSSKRYMLESFPDRIPKSKKLPAALFITSFPYVNIWLLIVDICRLPDVWWDRLVLFSVCMQAIAGKNHIIYSIYIYISIP